MMISKDIISDEKAMLQCIQKEEKHVPKNCSSNKHVIQVELETHGREENV